MLLQHCMIVLRRLPAAICEVSLACICVAQPGPMSIYCSDTVELLCLQIDPALSIVGDLRRTSGQGRQEQAVQLTRKMHLGL